LLLQSFKKGGESEGGISLVARWAQVRAAQTELFQENLARHERRRTIRDELEQKRQQRIRQRHQRRWCDTSPESFAQLELEIQQRFSVRGTVGNGNGVSQDCKRENASSGVGALVERAPYGWEQQEFQEWFGLAERFGLVDDFHWEGGQYWVALGDRVWPFVEMFGVFTVGWLRGALKVGGGFALNEDFGEY
jgi:hypothetical protein